MHTDKAYQFHTAILFSSLKQFRSFVCSLIIIFNNCIFHLEFPLWKIRVALPGESQLRKSRAIHSMVHAECFSVSAIHRSLPWTTGSLKCAQMLMHATAYGECTDTVRESTFKGDSGRKIPCRTGESNLRQRRAGSTLDQLSYIPTFPHPLFSLGEIFSTLFTIVFILVIRK